MDLLECSSDNFKILLEGVQCGCEEISEKNYFSNFFSTNHMENNNKDSSSEAHLKSSKTSGGSFLDLN